MLRFIFTKIKNKYRLYLALLAGVISMIAVFGVIMMLRKGSLDRLIQSAFTSYYEAEGKFPSVVSRTGSVVLESGEDAAEAVLAGMKSYEDTWDNYLSLPVVNAQRIAWMKGRRSIFSYRGDSGYLDIGFMDTDYNGSHFELLDGTFPKEAEELPRDHYWCLIDRHTMDVNHFVVGETLTMNELDGPEDEPVVFHIAGIVKEAGTEDYFWQKSLFASGLMLYVEREDFAKIAADHHMEKAQYETFRVYDYRKITVENLEAVRSYLEQFKEQDENLTENFTSLLTDAEQKGVSVKAVLYAIAVPLLLLVFIFISMIAVRIVSSETGEIAMLHSRGMSRGRIILIYFIQSVILAAVSFGPGLLLGYGVGMLTASSTGFLTFSGDAVPGYGIYPGMILVSGLAAFVAAIIMLLPVIPRSGSTVIEQKNRRHNSGLPLWEKFFLDVALLGVSIYLFFNFTRQMDQLKLSVLAGEGIDPMIFLTSTFSSSPWGF
ncbi:MAG: ABC transporter permease [Eubacterium sp.]|nr:ABC transporter permease [Eubacterium sp.]